MPASAQCTSVRDVYATCVRVYVCVFVCVCAGCVGDMRVCVVNVFRSRMEGSASDTPAGDTHVTHHPVWGAAGGSLGARAAKLLLFLMRTEVERLQVRG